jgi:hypothetical protein
MVRKFVARVAFLGVLGFGLLACGYAVAGVSAPEAQAGCFGWNGIFLNFGWCDNFGYGGYGGNGGYGGYPGVGYPGPGYYPPNYQPFYPPVYNVGNPCGCY